MTDVQKVAASGAHHGGGVTSQGTGGEIREAEGPSDMVEALLARDSKQMQVHPPREPALPGCRGLTRQRVLQGTEGLPDRA